MATTTYSRVLLTYSRVLLTYSRVIWINRVRLPNLLVINCTRGKYIDYICTGTVLLFVLVCIPGTSIFFIWGHIFVHGSLLYNMHICVTTAVYM